LKGRKAFFIEFGELEEEFGEDTWEQREGKVVGGLLDGEFVWKVFFSRCFSHFY